MADQFGTIYEIVQAIPKGRVMTYGQVALEARATARTVGWALAVVGDHDIPWQRVVGADGYLRIGRRSPELMTVQRQLLESEGVTFRENGCVNLDAHQVGAE